MPTQTSFSELEYAAKKKLTRRDRFLAEIEAVTPWRERVAVIEPHYPKGSRGRPPIGPERMLRMKAHVGVDAESGLVHTVVGTAANVSDVTQAHALLHGEETDVFADAGYRGVDIARFLPKMTAPERQIAPSRCNPCAPQCMRGLDGHLFSGSDIRQGGEVKLAARAMVILEKFENMRRAFGSHASWAVWGKSLDGRPKSGIGDLGIFEGAALCGTLPLLRTDVVLVGLNLSRPLDRALRNFHDPHPHAQDYKIRHAVEGTHLAGAYMTDVIKDFVEVDSSKVRALLQDPGEIERQLSTFRKELEMLESRPVIVAFGDLAHKVLSRGLRRDEYRRLIRAPQYSARMSKEDYRKALLGAVSVVASPPAQL